MVEAFQRGSEVHCKIRHDNFIGIIVREKFLQLPKTALKSPCVYEVNIDERGEKNSAGLNKREILQGGAGRG